MTKRGFISALVMVFVFLGSTAAPASDKDGLRILISNDDGIEAPGLAALFDALSTLGTVTVAAPSQGRSAASHGIVTDGPILVRESERKGSRWYAIDALPATCVRLALENLLDKPPDIVVSGINRGENVGVVTFYSATVACAREAAFKGIPAVAVSLESGETMDYGAAAKVAVLIVQEYLAGQWPAGIYLNVNVPALEYGLIKGFRVVPQDTRASGEAFEGRTNPRGTRYFWPLYQPLGSGDVQTDVWAVRNGYVSISPFRIDQTDPSVLERLGKLETVPWKR